MKFSLVIPCYNEYKNLPSLLKRCQFLLKNKDVEIILVNNGSTDKSENFFKTKLYKNQNLKYVSLKENKGYGFGILFGLRHAKGQIIGWTHSDLQTDPSDVQRGITFFESQDSDAFVKGRRKKRKILDNIFTIGMSFFETVLLREFLWDINAQPTMFSKKFYETWNSAPFDYSLDLYAYYLAKKQKKNVFRFPVFFNDRLHGASHWNFGLHSKFKFIVRTIKYSLSLKRKLNNDIHSS